MVEIVIGAIAAVALIALVVTARVARQLRGDIDRHEATIADLRQALEGGHADPEPWRRQTL